MRVKLAYGKQGLWIELLDAYGPQASICVLPEGPMTIPYVD
jgi:hypothetical protein